ncbi:hypothetical protein DDW06_01885 [Sulfolobales archaeon SCGC AB-777_K20]|nr:hypothetical protein DDW06_01885 [Sulfolobales archaeon SCGC AB-777_K20]
MRITSYSEQSVYGHKVVFYQIEVEDSKFITPIKALTKAELIAKQYSASNIYLPDYVFICSSSFKKSYVTDLDSELIKLRNLLSSNNKIFIYIPSISENTEDTKVDAIKYSVKYQYELQTSILAVPIEGLSREEAVDIVKNVVKDYKDQSVFPVVGIDSVSVTKELIHKVNEISGIIIRFDKKNIESYNEIHSNVKKLYSIVEGNNKLPIFVDLPKSFRVIVRSREYVIESTTLLRYFFSGILSYNTRFRLSRRKLEGDSYYRLILERFNASAIIDPITLEPISLGQMMSNNKKFEEIKKKIKQIAKPDDETVIFLLDHIEEAFRESDIDKKRIISSLVDVLNSVIIHYELEDFRKDAVSSTSKNKSLQDILRSFSGLEMF